MKKVSLSSHHIVAIALLFVLIFSALILLFPIGGIKIAADAAAYAASEEAYIIKLNEKQARIQNLVDAQSAAYRIGDTQTAEILGKELKALGVRNLSTEELFTEFNMVMPLSDDHDGIYNEYDTYSKQEYILDVPVDGIWYAVRFILITPINTESRLFYSGNATTRNIDALDVMQTVAKISANKLLGKIELPKKFEIINLLIDVISIASESYIELQPTDIVEDISASYTWSAAESCCFTFLPTAGGGMPWSLVGVSNTVSIDLTTIIPSMRYNNGQATANNLVSTMHTEYKSPMYQNFQYPIHYYRLWDEDYAFEHQEMLQSFDIFGLNGEKIHTVEIQTPHDLMDIYT